jgi:hypothetical protein
VSATWVGPSTPPWPNAAAPACRPPGDRSRPRPHRRLGSVRDQRRLCPRARPAAGAADTPLDLEVRSGSLRADLPVGPATVSLRASAFEEDRGSGLAGARATAGGNALSATAAVQPSADRPGWRLQVWRRESDLANTSVAVSADRATTTPANDQYETPATGWGVNAALRRIVVSGIARVEWELGADARFAEGETHERFRYMAGAFTRDRIAGGETSVLGLYAEGSWTTARGWSPAACAPTAGRAPNGHRLERDLATGLPTLDETDPDRSGQVVSARLGVRRDIWGRTGPARRRLYRLPPRHPERVAPPVPRRQRPDRGQRRAAARDPDRRRGGLELDRRPRLPERHRLLDRLDDAIVNVTIGTGPATFPRAGFVPAGGVLRQRQNAGTIEATGLELDGRLTLTDDPQSLRAALSLTEPEIDGGGAAPQLTGLRPAQAPRFSAVAGFDWKATDRLSWPPTCAGRATASRMI